MRRSRPPSLVANLLRGSVLVVVLGSVVLACSGTPDNQPDPDPEPPPETRIGIRTVGGAAEFFDRETGERFVPRGHNYVKYTEKIDPHHGPGFYDMVLSPTRFDPDETRQDFEEMSALGYNVARVFLETCAVSDCIYPEDGTGRVLSDDYLDNIVSMLAIAEQTGIYLWLTSNTLPDSGYYLELAYSGESELIHALNAEFLTNEGLEAYRQYFSDLFGGLISRDANFESLFSFSIRNEYSSPGDVAPYSLASGTLAHPSGESYDLSDPDQHRELAEDALIFWIDEMVATLDELVPTMLVSVGFFAPNEPNVWREGDTRIVHTSRALAESNADFFDLHSYPAPAGLTMEQHDENYGAVGYEVKPLVLGEYGAFKSHYPSVHVAAQELAHWQKTSCERGYDGWLVWHWEGDVVEGDGLWGGKEEPVASSLAPALHPDPCDEVTVPNPNVAHGKPVSASSTFPGDAESPPEPAENAVDGTGAQWGAGADAPQWIEIDLGEPMEVARLQLTVAQYPPGNTVHEIRAGAASNPPALIHTFSGSTEAGDVLVHEFVPPVAGVRYLRVNTTDSVSWVAWREIEVFGP